MNLYLSGTELETERMTDFEKFGLQRYSMKPTKSEVSFAYDRNSMSDLANNINVATNDMGGRIGNKTWCICECCASMETSIESVCCLEILRFLSQDFQVCCVCKFVDQIHILLYNILYKKNQLSIGFPPTFDPCQIRIKFFYWFRLHHISLNILLN